MDHFVITKFNLPTRRAPGLWKDPAWLDLRLKLFRAYCAPSMSQQTSPATWILLLSHKSPRNLIEALERIVPQAHLLFLSEGVHGNDDKLRKYLHQHCRSDFLITTRLDSDDALHRRFIEIVQAKAAFLPASPTGRTFLEFPLGCTFDGKDLRSYVDPRGPFLSLLEPNSDSISTVRCGNHRKFDLGSDAFASIETEEPMWLQGIHQANLMNKMRGNPVTNRTVLRDFGIAE